MKRFFSFALLAGLLLAACAPSNAQIQLTLQQTQTAAPTATPAASATPVATTTADVTATISPNQVAAWDTFEATITSLIVSVIGVRVVHWVRLDGNIIDIDLQTKWQAADSQPQVHFDVIRTLSGFCTNTMEQQILDYTGVKDPSIRITTESVDELYVFQSLTTFQQCVSVGFGDLNFKDWQPAANLTQTK
jgi:hypothetical protein